MQGDYRELIDAVRGVIGLDPLPDELAPYRRCCVACGRKHRACGEHCARCSGHPCGLSPRKPSGIQRESNQ